MGSGHAGAPAAGRPVGRLRRALRPDLRQPALYPYRPGLEVAAHEPGLALDGGPDGLRLIEPLLSQAVTRTGAWRALLLEIEAGEGESAAEARLSLLPAAEIRVLPDLAGKPRFLKITGIKISMNTQLLSTSPPSLSPPPYPCCTRRAGGHSNGYGVWPGSRC